MFISVSTYGDILSFLERNMFKCPIKSITGIDCPGCGMQRSVLLLMRGEVYESIKQYPATITLLLMLVFLVLHLKFKFAHGAAVLKYIFIFNAIIITVNFIIKQIH
jgi:hypothetical protein